MNQYWASFRETGTATYRLDTRVYLQAIERPSGGDSCLGAIVGKNPGSARPSTRGPGLAGLLLGYDQFLRAVRDIPTRAYQVAEVDLPARAYIQVLNLFYLCDPNLRQAVRSLLADPDPIICESECRDFTWVWYAWGGDSTHLNRLKQRFATIRSRDHFYYDLGSSKVIADRPSNSVTAKHTQGLPRQPVIDHLAGIILRCD